MVVTLTNESGKSESEPRRAPELFHGVPDVLSFHVALSSQLVNILEAEISTVPEPETAVRVKSALSTS